MGSLLRCHLGDITLECSGSYVPLLRLTPVSHHALSHISRPDFPDGSKMQVPCEYQQLGPVLILSKLRLSLCWFIVYKICREKHKPEVRGNALG